MYVLARGEQQSILMCGGAIRLKVLSIQGKTVRLGIEAPKEIDIVREEVADKRGIDPAIEIMR